MAEYEHAVFISYAWGEEREEIVNQIDKALEARGIKIVRDKRDLGYKGFISKFMERIGQGNCVIVVISDKYLRSPNCMFELVEIADGKDFHNRIFPIVLSDANIYDPLKRIEYVKYWEKKRKELAKAMKTLDPANLQGLREDMDLYDRIRDKISGLTSILKDMNTLTPDMHKESDFTQIYDGIERRMKDSPAAPASTPAPPTQEASKSAQSAPSGGSPSTASAPPAQNINFGGSAQFSAPVQFGNTQNIYYNNLAPAETKTPGLEDEIELEYFEPETIYIPEGPFLMGSPEGADVPIYETPQHEVYLPAYRIGMYPVTNDQYYEFIKQTGTRVLPVMGWDGQRPRSGYENYPVIGVKLSEALAYCHWLSERTKRKYTLPNEAQWEKACRGGKNTLYPWGNELDPKRSNHTCAALAAVDAFPPQNEFGCFDLVGNVRQWTSTLWGEKTFRAPDPAYAYPWKDDRRNKPNPNSQIRRVVRGASFQDDARYLRCSARSGQFPEADPADARHSFRVVRND